jgi:hypothetical protein
MDHHLSIVTCHRFRLAAAAVAVIVLASASIYLRYGSEAAGAEIAPPAAATPTATEPVAPSPPLPAPAAMAEAPTSTFRSTSRPSDPVATSESLSSETQAATRSASTPATAASVGPAQAPASPPAREFVNFDFNAFAKRLRSSDGARFEKMAGANLGKWMNLDGRFDHATETGTGKITVYFMGRTDNAGLASCTFATEGQQRINKLKKGQRVALRGAIWFFSSFGIVFRNCEFR